MALLLYAALWISPAAPQDTAPAAALPDFATEVRPLLARRCFACHGNDEETREAGLRLDSFAEATLDRDGFPAVVPGNAEDSEVMARILDEFDPMPPEETGDPLTPDEVDVLRRWIDGGAEYAPHWSFRAPSQPAIDGGEGRSAIDVLVAREHAARGLDWSPEADDYTLFRRLSLDLTGLPPTPEAARAYAESTDPAKYERAVDGLLNAPGYAERWAAVWLDLARYADSSGHGSDPLRTIWRYRDWVIEAFDENMPFDEFTVQQLAGDLLPEADERTKLATAFHRNTMTNTEGGTDDEEFRVLAVKDRVNTTMSVWMGLTAGCAECHSHKFDPISHVEYYQLFDIFNQTADTDRNDDRPRLATPTLEEAAREAELRAALDEAEAKLQASGGAGDASWKAAALSTTASELAGGTAIWTEPSGSLPSAVRLEIAGGAAAQDGGTGDEGSQPQDPQLKGAAGTSAAAVLSLRRRRADAAPVEAASVRIELAGADRILSLAEVELLDADGEVLSAAFESAEQSSTAYDGPARSAVDGNTSGAYDEGSVTHTAIEADPWWEGRLIEPQPVHGVRVWPRTDGSSETRSEGFRVSLLAADGSTVWRSAPAPAPRGDGEAGIGAAYLDVGPALGEPIAVAFASAMDAQLGAGAPPAEDGTTDNPRSQSVVFALGGGGEPADSLAGSPAEFEATFGDAFRGTSTSRLRLSTVTYDANYVRMRAERDAAAERLAALRPTTTPVMQELPRSDRRSTHVLTRGNFLQKAEKVQGAVPAAFPPLPDGVEPDRLALAEWLVSESNPLTARVTVNRVWARLFGRGLVLTEGDFGSQGTLPTHPELLDWLALEFREGGWDHKELLRTIVLSRTYRQASNVTERSAAHDPEGVWLSRYPRQRLEAEMVRDTALEVAGLLSKKRLGPSVYPPQPEGLWKAAFNGQRNWKESVGEDRYRRGLYVFLRRTIPYPMLATFDAPSRETCTVRRIPTNTPLQAFVTLNDPVFVEASQGLAERALTSGASSPEATIERMLWCAEARPPEAPQVELLVSLYRDAAEAFADDVEAAEAFGFAAPDGLDAAPHELAAWTLVASAVLNLDSVLTKE